MEGSCRARKSSYRAWPSSALRASCRIWRCRRSVGACWPGVRCMAEPLLRVRRASKRYPGGIEALRNADLEMERGEFVCLIGASGCGKSALLRMIAGFETASEGDVIMRARPVTGPERDRGMVFQDYGLFPWL